VKGRLHLWLLLPAAALASLWLAWVSLAMVDFLYPAWYRALDIHGHIERYAPQNRYREGFEQTTPVERKRIFGEVVDAIHDDGRGLADIRYHDSLGRDLGPVFHEAEIVHLQDVARLVSLLLPVGALAFGWTLVHLGLIRRFGWPVPSLARVVVATLATVAVGLAVLLGVGFRKVFYALHEAVFPPGHQWFFYYQDSLMSTMMKAPWLFAAIGAVLLAAAVLFYLALAALARRLSPAAAASPGRSP
jgi:hypothetical protein